MKREDVRALLKAGADAIDLQFGYGRLTEFNSLQDKAYPFAWVETLQTKTNFGGSGSTLIDEWEIVIHIAKQDRPDWLSDTYEQIVDDCDQLARKLIWQYNFVLGFDSASIIDSTTTKNIYKMVSLSGVSREPFVKMHAECLTGVILSFTLTSPDATDVCP